MPFDIYYFSAALPKLLQKQRIQNTRGGLYQSLFKYGASKIVAPTFFFAALPLGEPPSDKLECTLQKPLSNKKPQLFS
jgi:hypothetical protein